MHPAPNCFDNVTAIQTVGLQSPLRAFANTLQEVAMEKFKKTMIQVRNLILGFAVGLDMAAES
jgi:hypothetical protein